MQIAVKIAALFCAISLWFFVVMDRDYEIKTSIPIQYKGMSALLAPVTPLQQKQKVILKGKGFELSRLWFSPSLVYLAPPLSRLKPTRQKMEWKSSHFHSELSSVQLIQFLETTHLELDLDTKIERRIPVQLNAKIHPADGYLLARNPKMIPSEIVIQGARSVLTRIYGIQTQGIAIDNIKNRDTIEIPLALDQLPSTVIVPQKNIHLVVSSTQKFERRFESIPVQLVGPAQTQIDSIFPKNITLLLTGEEHYIRKLQSRDLRIFLESGRMLLEESDSLTPTVVLPEGVLQWQTIPSHIHYYRNHRNSSHVQ